MKIRLKKIEHCCKLLPGNTLDTFSNKQNIYEISSPMNEIFSNKNIKNIIKNKFFTAC